MKHENWKEIFANYIEGDMVNILSVSQNQVIAGQRYKPQSDTEKSFLSKMKEI